jgi:hypothetical protein
MKREIKTPEKEGTVSRRKIKEVVKQNPPRQGKGLAELTYIEPLDAMTNSVIIHGVVLERPERCSYCREKFEEKDKFVFVFSADAFDDEGKIEIEYEALHSEIAGYCSDEIEKYYKDSCFVLSQEG